MTYGLNRILKAILAATLTVATLAIVSDSAPQKDPASQLKLSRLMPKGALLYAQSSDLTGQFKLWRASAAHDKYFSSKSYQTFQESRLFLKLQSRTKEFETAMGLQFDEDTIASLAGGASAISVYDLGKLEMVVVSEMPRTKAFATVLFAHAKSFDERTTAAGTTYYVREFVSDGGRSQQRVAFAYADGDLVLASSESLLQRTLDNTGTKQSADRLSDEITPTLAKATGFAAHNVTVWLNQAKLNANHYFNSYWIHGNRDDLSKLQAGLIDLEISVGALRERRWFTLGTPDQTGTQASRSKKSTGRPNSYRFKRADGWRGRRYAGEFASIRACWFSIYGSARNRRQRPKIDVVIGACLFRQLPESDGSGSVNRSSFSDSSDNANNDKDKAGRYRHLDSRYDRDIDDEAAVKLTSTSNERTVANERFSRALSTVISQAKPTAFVVIETPVLPNGQILRSFQPGCRDRSR